MYIIRCAFLWIDSSRSLRYTGGPAHTGEVNSSTDLIMLQYTSTRSGERSPHHPQHPAETQKGQVSSGSNMSFSAMESSQSMRDMRSFLLQCESPQSGL